jgi:hypothetical protein
MNVKNVYANKVYDYLIDIRFIICSTVTEDCPICAKSIDVTLLETHASTCGEDDLEVDIPPGMCVDKEAEIEDLEQ